MDTHHPVVARLLKPGTGDGPRECCGWHHPGRVKSSIPEVFQQATWLAHVSWELERAKHALPLDSLKEQELVVHQDTHHDTSRRDGGSVVSVDHQHRRPQAPPFGMFPLLGRGRSAVCLLVGFKEYEVLLRTEVRCSLPTFNRLVVSPAPPRPVGTFNHYELDEVLRFPLDTSGEKPAAGCFLWLFEFLLLDVVGGLHLYVSPSF